MPKAEYSCRALQANEVSAFLDHLGIVFGVPKPSGAPGAPRSHFADHWEQDPDATTAGVFIACKDDTVSDGSDVPPDGDSKAIHKALEIVSSVRVYRRVMNITAHTKLAVGAIGDVATKTDVCNLNLMKRIYILC
jgi:hypothetical protein